MTIYKRKYKKEIKEGTIKKEGNFTYKFINGNWRLIYYKYSDDLEIWYDYDEQGNIIHTKDSGDYEYWVDYEDKEISKEQFDKLWEKVK